MQANKERINNKNSKISKQTHIIEEIGGNGEIQYNCTACRKTFRSRSQRYYHINCNELQKLTYKCDHCDKCFARITQWKYHTESHVSPINKCQNCQKTFSNPLALKKHEALHKVEPKPCPHCDKTFKKKISFDQHLAAQHHNQLQYGCAYCNKKYASKSSLQLHLQTHEKKRFECTFCGKLFQRNSILNLHLKRHYETNCYICAVCHKNFSESGALTRHRKIHEESVTQYYCKLCDKSIIRKDNMTRHLITIHPEEKFDNIVKIMRPPTTPTQLRVNVELEDIAKSNKQSLIIENKLLHKPIDPKESVIDLPKSLATKIDSVEYPQINQIKVITAVSTYKKELLSHRTEITSQEIITPCKNTNHLQQEQAMFLENQQASYKNARAIAASYDFIKSENKVEQSDNNAENISFVDFVQSHLKKSNQTDQQIVEQELDKSQEYFHTYKNELKTFENHEPPLTLTFSSVIRSVGNVKKNLTSHTLTQPINHTPLEYKHKKYCRNHYNIDLYRKILGCDGDDDEDVEKQQHFDHMQKSSTPVHWRKCFKNNYETSAS